MTPCGNAKMGGDISGNDTKARNWTCWISERYQGERCPYTLPSPPYTTILAFPSDVISSVSQSRHFSILTNGIVSDATLALLKLDTVHHFGVSKRGQFVPFSEMRANSDGMDGPGCKV